MFQGGSSTSLVNGSFSLTTHLHGDRFRSIQWGSPLPSYDVVVLLLQPMDFESLKKGVLGFFIALPSSTPYGGLIASPMGTEGCLAQLLHIVRRGLDPFCIVIEVLEVIPMHLLVEIVQENGVPQRVLLLYEMPLGSILLHMSRHGSGEGFSFLGGDI